MGQIFYAGLFLVSWFSFMFSNKPRKRYGRKGH